MAKKKITTAKKGTEFTVKKKGTFKHGTIVYKVPKLEIGTQHRKRLVRDLIDVHSIQSTTYDQSRMLDFIINKCEEYGATIDMDQYGNLYATKGEAKVYPLVVAHTDTVHRIIPDSDFQVIEGPERIFAVDKAKAELTGVGGDDNVGIFLALQLLKNNDNIKAAFFKDEESGCIGSGQANFNILKSEEVSFMMQGDRRGYHDVTSSIMNLDMSSTEFRETLKPVLEKFNRSWVDGGMTDVWQLASEGFGVSGFNASCGYYRPHTSQEYIVIDEVLLTLQFFQEVINTLYDGETRYPFKSESGRHFYRSNYRYRSYGRAGEIDYNPPIKKITGSSIVNRNWEDDWEDAWSNHNSSANFSNDKEIESSADEDLSELAKLHDATCVDCGERCSYDDTEYLYWCQGCNEYKDWNDLQW